LAQVLLAWHRAPHKWCAPVRLTMASSDKEPILPVGETPMPTADVALKPLISWHCFWCCVVPSWFAITIVCILTHGVVAASVVGAMPVLMLASFLVLHICARNSFQLWALQRPEHLFARLFLPSVEVLQSFYMGWNGTKLELDKLSLPVPPPWCILKQRWGGMNFCASGEVWMGSFADVERALTQPQARTSNLGEHPLLWECLPDVARSRCVFLLALSDVGAGGTGIHSALKSCLIHYFWGEGLQSRLKDSTTERLVAAFVEDYKSMPHGSGEAFFTDYDRGLIPFVVKYLHYVLLGITSDDPATHHKLMTACTERRKTQTSGSMVLDIISRYTTDAKNLLYFLTPMGYMLTFQRKELDEVIAIYENSPALANFKDGNPAFFNMTRRECAALMVSIVRIAGFQGTQLLLTTLLGGIPFPAYPGTNLSAFRVTDVLDKLDLGDPAALKRYIMESVRLAAPVTISHRVSTGSFRCNINGKSYTFPKGTKIAIPICMANVDAEYWGPTTFDFDMDRPRLAESFMGFNSVGGRSNGRECPGKDLVMNLAVELLQRVGRARRST